ncbi:MAG TPA: cupredoxin domain-containing protein [Acidobacteriaceae bacterium]|jgi:cytochrome c oxidase subunit 2|nr:cupredoxin domain-containing protein [Acidobacteriaceae bacterium]
MKKIAFLMMLLAGIFAGSTAPRLAAQAGPRKVVVVAKRFAYEPTEITLKKGEPVVLVLQSRDVAHGLRFRELNLNIKVKAGSTTEVPFTPMQTGDFTGHCSVFCGAGHGSMTLTMHVVE